MMQEVIAQYGRLDLLINNAGIDMPGSIVHLPPKEWERAFQVNCMSQVHAIKRAIPIMEKQTTAGIIVNVASASGLISLPCMPAYSATKHFSVALTESVSLDLQEAGSRI